MVNGIKVIGIRIKPKLSVILAVVHDVSSALSCIITQGDVIAMILWFAVSTDVNAALSYYTDQEK